MRQEWIERMHDQARAEMGYCVPSPEGQWCDTHSTRKPVGQVCDAMRVAYSIAESASEVMEELARADERERDYDPSLGLVARGVMSNEHDTDSCEADCCRERDTLAERDLIAKIEEQFSGWLSPEEVAGQMELARADARAEVARLGFLLEQAEEDRERFDGERLTARAEVLNLHAEIHQANADWYIVKTERDAAREVLADLRAKVKALPGTGGGRLGSGFVAMPGDGDCVQRADVLALLPKQES